MSKLVKPTEYAKEQGISRQAVYAKIKKGVLNSKTVDGKIYIIVEDTIESKMGEKLLDISTSEAIGAHLIDVKELLTSKEQTISVLKESISDLKHTNTEINTTLRGEIELLKQVFTEMRNLYVKQVDYMVIEKKRDIDSLTTPIEEVSINERSSKEEEECWIGLEEFFNRCKISKEKRKVKITKRLKKAFKNQDARIKMEGEHLYLSCYHFYEDILNKKQ